MVKANFSFTKEYSTYHSHSDHALSCYSCVILKMAQCSGEKHQSCKLSESTLWCLILNLMEGCMN